MKKGLHLLVDIDEYVFKAALRAETRKFSVSKDGKQEPFLWSDRESCVVYGIDNDPDGSKDIEPVIVPDECPTAGKLRFDEQMEYLLSLDEVEALTLCYGYDTNYREAIGLINPYKGNRVTEKPVYYKEVLKHALSSYPVFSHPGVETDDVLGRTQTTDGGVMRDSDSLLEACILSQDKDLKTIPGKAMKVDWSKREYEVVNITEYEARRYFYHQLLTGDSADNIKAIPGIGPKKADTILEGKTTNLLMFQAVYKTYEKAMRLPLDKRSFRSDKFSPLPSITDRSVESVMYELGTLLYIQRSDESYWWPKEVNEGMEKGKLEFYKLQSEVNS